MFTELHVSDLALAKAFYVLLGFSVAWEDAGHMVMARGSDALAFHRTEGGIAEHEHFRNVPAGKNGYAVEIVIPVDDLDTAHEKLAKFVVMPPKKRAWGVRDFRIEDPFGFYVCVTERYDPTRPVRRA